MGLNETREAEYEFRKSMREAYNRGYEQGKKDAIPMEWIKKKRDEVVSDYKYIIDWLILEWEKEQGEIHNGNQ